MSVGCRPPGSLLASSDDALVNPTKWDDRFESFFLEATEVKDNSTRPGVAPLLLVPIDCVRWIVGRELFVRLARVIVGRTQSAHGTVCDVGAVFLRDVVMPLSHSSRIFSKLAPRGVEPFRENALYVIAITGDGPLTSSLPHEMGFPIPLPRLFKRGGRSRGLFFNVHA